MADDPGKTAPEETEKQKRKRAKSVLSLLIALEKEILQKGHYDLIREGIFQTMLRASLVKAFEYARFCNRIKPSKANEACYFMASTLRGVCEELIVLRFIRQLPESERDEVIAIEMARSLAKAVSEQAKFFKAVRPFQPVLDFQPEDATVQKQRDRIDEIGRTSHVWKPNKGKLPPTEQMSQTVGMRPIYDYFYRISSDVVHFNPRIAFRSGWGNDKDGRTGRFSTANFARYYLFYGQIYGVFLLTQFCRSFEKELALSKSFMKKLDGISLQLAEIIRWPEAVTFEEMNLREPGWFLRTVLKVAHDEKWDDKTTRENLRELAKVARKAGLLEPRA